MKKIVNTKNAPQAIGPYSQGVIKNNMVFISGQLPINPSTGEVAEGIENQTNVAIKNITEVLKEGGASIEDVVKCTVFLKDMNDFAKMNEVYGKFFTENEPARVAVEVARLPKDVLVEIDAIAII